MFKNLLGTQELKIANLLDLNENILLSGINSIGISTVTRAILEVMSEKNKLTLHLFSFEIENLGDKEIEQYFIYKLKSLYGIDLDTIDDLFTKTNFKLIVAVNKLDSFKIKDIFGIDQYKKIVLKKYFKDFPLTIIVQKYKPTDNPNNITDIVYELFMNQIISEFAIVDKVPFYLLNICNFNIKLSQLANYTDFYNLIIINIHK